MSNKNTGKKGDILLDMRDIVIDGYSDDRWHEIVKGVDITLRRGEIMGVIGESGAGKSTLVKALSTGSTLLKGERLLSKDTKIG